MGQNQQQLGYGKTNQNGYLESINVEGKNRALVQPYQIDPSNQTKYAVITALLSHPTEGFLSLFKGAFSKWMYEMLHLLLQPTLESLINESTGVYEDSSLLQYNDTGATSIFALMASHLVVGYLLSPLEIVRTRLSVQSLSPIHRKYNGILDCLKKINSEEGGLIMGVYLNPFHAIPAFVQHTVNPFFSNFGNVIFSRVLDLDPYMDPFKLNVASLFWRLSQLFVSLPVDTVRKRLMAQPNYKFIGNGSVSPDEKFREFKTVVKISSVPYTGMINCAWRVVTEEGDSGLRANTKVLRDSLNPYETQRRSNSEKDSYHRGADGRSDKGKNRKNDRSSPLTQQKKSKTDASGYGINLQNWSLRGLYPGLLSSVLLNISIFGLSLISVDIDETAY
ncbi:Mitochondrial substrate carrier family protein B [Smittium mucronatum]|uniref:Mitochondrial substrate carrier family protein B n=1 Tax=Smittium mucronatum TaxID=133383 RepID=A0A1R0GUN6_9FUNG|nr:Mitochondrial substrate carrier family protein B [Smittium mucronatum]